MCFSAALKVVDCVEKAVTPVCGKEAAKFQARKEKLFLQPAVGNQCDLDPAEESGEIGKSS